ncbi:MAG: CoA transferase [Chloroflexi bacterium]|nr:CoA transferase [Chloroflexota bacterium]
MAGGYCGRLLAEVGAQVLKVEKPCEGDPSRHEGPFPDDLPHIETSLLFQYTNANKRSITLDATTQQGADILRKIISLSDVVIEERPGGAVEQAGMGYAVIQEMNPTAVVVTISPFGQHGQKRTWKGSSLNIEHASGMGWLTPTGLSRRLFPERHPLKMGGHIAEYFVSFAAATGVMFGLIGRMISGRSQHIDLSSQDALVSLERGCVSQYANRGYLETPQTRDFPYGGCFPCADGYVEILAHEDHHWAGLAEMIEKPEWSRDPIFAKRDRRVTRSLEINEAIEAWTQKHTRQQVYELGVRHGVPVGIFNSPADVIASEHERARGFFRPVSHPLIRKMTSIPALPFLMAPVPEKDARPAPLLGEHNEEVYCLTLGFSRGDLVDLRQARII